MYVWQDDRNSVNLQSSYVQHYSSSGTRLFPLNGSEGSSEPGYNKFDAWASYMISGNETYLVWKQANSLQSQFAIYGQRFSPAGARLWTDNAKEFIPYGSNSFINQVCYSFDTNTVVAFNEGIFGSINNLQKSFITGKSGVMGWGSTVKNISSIISEKSKTVAAMDNQGMTKIVWSDGRNGAADIYAQNINISGQLGITGVFINNNNQPVKFLLSQNFPNPFNPVTVISYRIAAGSFVSLKVFDILGNNIAELINEKQSPGSYVVNFDGSNMPSGIYFYTLNAGSFKETKRMLLIK